METKKLFAAILSLGLLVPSVQPVKAENDSNNAETEQAKRDTQTSDDTCTKNPEYASKKDPSYIVVGKNKSRCFK